MQIKILQFENYIETIRKSVGSTMFQTTWAEVDGERKDITKAGQTSCASYVSKILMIFSEFGLLKMKHAGTQGLLTDMRNCGWIKIDEPKVGSIIHWEKALQNGEENEHIGFYIGDNKAISNSSKRGTPEEHHFTYGEQDGTPNRKIIGIYWHPKLDNKFFE